MNCEIFASIESLTIHWRWKFESMPFSFCVILLATLNSITVWTTLRKTEYSLLSIIHGMFTSLLLIRLYFHKYLSRHYNNRRMTRIISGCFSLSIILFFFNLFIYLFIYLFIMINLNKDIYKYQIGVWFGRRDLSFLC